MGVLFHTVPLVPKGKATSMTWVMELGHTSSALHLSGKILSKPLHAEAGE